MTLHICQLTAISFLASSTLPRIDGRFARARHLPPALKYAVPRGQVIIYIPVVNSPSPPSPPPKGL